MINILDFLFPKRCVGCQKIGSYFCRDCIETITQKELICPFCKRLALGGMTHPVCERRGKLDGLWSFGAYEGVLRKAIQKIKYRWITELAGNLIDLNLEYWAKSSPYFLDQIKKDGGADWIVVPVPLHKSRQNWRGFNQSALLGKLLASKIGLEYKEALIRIKNTTPQVRLEADKRRENIRGAFALKNNSDLLTLNSVILIDDVWTTGSTLQECCWVLKKNGAKKVWAITLAR